MKKTTLEKAVLSFRAWPCLGAPAWKALCVILGAVALSAIVSAAEPASRPKGTPAHIGSVGALEQGGLFLGLYTPPRPPAIGTEFATNGDFEKGGKNIEAGVGRNGSKAYVGREGYNFLSIRAGPSLGEAVLDISFWIRTEKGTARTSIQVTAFSTYGKVVGRVSRGLNTTAVTSFKQIKARVKIPWQDTQWTDLRFFRQGKDVFIVDDVSMKVAGYAGRDEKPKAVSERPSLSGSLCRFDGAALLPPVGNRGVWQWTGAGAWDHKVGYKDTHSIRFTHILPLRSRLSTRIPPYNGTGLFAWPEHMVGFLVKTQGVKKGVVRLVLSRRAPLPGSARAWQTVLPETSDWTFYHVSTDVLGNLADGMIELEFKGTGTIWVDNFQIVPALSIKRHPKNWHVLLCPRECE